MTWGIIGALDQEIALIKENMEVRESKFIYGSTFYAGTIYGQEAVLVCCSIGKVNAAACASIVLREFGADAVINIGIAGCAAPELGTLDVVISSEAVFHDIYSGFMRNYYPYTDVFKADQKLIDLAVKTCDALPDKNFKYKVGKVATGDVFVEKKEVKQGIVDLCNPDCLEMEGASIAQVAYMNEKPFLIIRTMSDDAEDGATALYDNFIDLAAHNSASIILNMIQNNI